MADSCPIIAQDGVAGQVVTTMNTMQAYAVQAFNVSLDSMRDIRAFDVPTLNYNDSFRPFSNWWTYMRPHAPADPELVYDPNTDSVPQPPAITFGDPINFEDAPVDTLTAPVIATPTAPTDRAPSKTFTDPVLPPLVVPAAPDTPFPDEPTLYALTLPDPVVIPLRTFDGVRPNLNLNAPANTFSFTPQQYMSALLDKTRNQISFMLDGQTGLPLAVIQALRGRAYDAVDAEEVRTIQQAREEYGLLGWSEPSGILNARIAETRQNNQNKRADLNRDIYIQDQTIAVENMRFAVTNGVALESKLLDHDIAMQQLVLEGAKATIQATIDIFNSTVTLRNLELEQYKTDAQVLRDLIQADIAQIEVYKARLEGERLKGELNQQLVAIFQQKIQAVLAKVQIYESQVRAVEAQSRINVAIVEAKRIEIEAFVAEIHAYEAQWNAYKVQIDAGLSKAQIFSVLEQAYATRVTAVLAKNTNKIEQKRLTIAENELNISAYKALLEQFTTVIDAEVKRIQSLVQVYQARIEKYRADAGIEQVASESNQKIVQVAIEQERERFGAAREVATINIQQLQNQAALLLKALEGIASVSAQLAAGAMSASSVHASISSSLSQAQSCATEFRFDESVAST
jgi:hypothetical protein